MKAYILHHFSNLRAKYEAEAKEKQEVAVVVESVTPLTPLLPRLKKFVESLDNEQRRQPQSLEFFRQGLRGRQGNKAHAGELGACLRKLNYTRRRAWSESEGGFRALWYPPN